ncbi:hypothetical protein EHW99_1301 [Erwinia amylovora]|uniref:Uncharacterized protein n=3 Tax=Erwinia amylovora TaxID=552 RepID=A0A830ZX02_ERWAM|nr:hypothetical protein EaACW_2305 [Erwinia amylovora ACW56400]QJQ54006.1 hypothetical protein EHX00_1301 [Erwinia amylovora]CBA21434.1 hypothetical protein predicted by Glimmer/Critica [Erwinia amylovora CFBP1430]CBX81170.1 hypothetical protein predicted by Glimmer/Critica [Erwinia amylovora ATCC BAA-2158]CCO79148.1 hypothetical protein BN432_2360 [Erwinia amylovora Ea356]CCO82954.1 hypothetical protein BN433_2393 [Erwinia amylovora Ea266]CCO86722.1 hypothetical protein BN434_2343 [Erwinia a
MSGIQRWLREKPHSHENGYSPFRHFVKRVIFRQRIYALY